MTIVQYNEGVNVERLSKYVQSIWHGRVLYSVIVAGLVMIVCISTGRPGRCLPAAYLADATCCKASLKCRSDLLDPESPHRAARILGALASASP